MHTLSSRYGFIPHRSSSSFFLTRTAQQVKSQKDVHELARAAAALLGLVSWGGLLLLLAG
jgi:hypothetical protein